MVFFERVCFFIDGSNFYHSLRETFETEETDFGAEKFKALVDFLLQGRSLISCFYYNAPLDRSKNDKVYWKQQKFFDNLRALPGFNVVLCRMRKNENGTYTVKGDDINLAIDMVSLAYENAYDTAVLVSGDGDFVPAIKKTQKLGKKVENAYFCRSYSSYLRKTCDKSTMLDSAVEKLLGKNSLGPASSETSSGKAGGHMV